MDSKCSTILNVHAQKISYNKKILFKNMILKEEYVLLYQKITSQICESMKLPCEPAMLSRRKLNGDLPETLYVQICEC